MNRRTGNLILTISLIALTGLVMPPVQADYLIPTITHVYFEKGGLPYNDSVDYSINCYGHYLYASYPAEQTGPITPELVYHYSATCEEYGCTIYPQYYLKYTHIDWCDLEGKTAEGPFNIRNFSTKPYSEWSTNTPRSISVRSSVSGSAYEENEEYRYHYYITPEYQACIGHANSIIKPGRNTSAETRIYTSCTSGTDEQCFSIFEGRGAVTGGTYNYTRFVNLTRDRMDEVSFNQYLDTCDPLSDKECGGWILDGKPMKTYTELFPFRQNATHLQVNPCDRFLIGKNSSLVIPESDRPDARDHCYEDCSVADTIANAYFTIPDENSPSGLLSSPVVYGSGDISAQAAQVIEKNAFRPDVWVTNLIAARILPWQNVPGQAGYFSNEAFKKSWTQVSNKTGPELRQSHSSVVMPDGSIVLMGGNNARLDTPDVWRSVDYGATWMLMTANAEWSARSGHSSVVMPDGSIILMGGSDETKSPYKNDTWRSTDYGRTWSLVNESSGWSARSRHNSVVLPDGSIVLMGGYSSIKSQGTSYNDTWRSTDYGRTWVLVNGSSGWPAGSGYCSAAMPDGSIVLMNGITRKTITSRGNGNEVWRSTDRGATWAQMTAHAEWSPRFGQSCVVMPDGSIIVTGGENGHSNLNDVWRSIDYGRTWTQITTNAGWNFHYRHSSVIMPDGSIVVIDDEFRSSVWRLQPAGPGLWQKETDGVVPVSLSPSSLNAGPEGTSSHIEQVFDKQNRSPVESLYCSIIELFGGKCT